VEDYKSNELTNKGFILLDKVFKDRGWILIKNDFDHISYIEKGKELDIFEITIDSTHIHAHVPLKNSPYNYVTSFTSYFEASEFIETKFKDFISLFPEKADC